MIIWKPKASKDKKPAAKLIAKEINAGEKWYHCTAHHAITIAMTSNAFSLQCDELMKIAGANANF